MKIKTAFILFLMTLTTSAFADFNQLCRFQDYRGNYLFNKDKNMSLVHSDLKLMEGRGRLPNGCKYEISSYRDKNFIALEADGQSYHMTFDFMGELKRKDQKALTSCITGGVMEYYYADGRADDVTKRLVIHYSADNSKVEIIEYYWATAGIYGSGLHNEKSVTCFNN